MELERKGVSTLTVVTDAFLDLGKGVSSALGAPDIGVAVVPHPIGGLGRNDVEDRARRVFSDIATALDAPRARASGAGFADVPRVLDFTGSWREINDRF